MDKILTYSFTENFLDNLCEYIQSEYLDRGQDISRLALVFGGKRPGLFVKRQLAQRLKQGYFPPKIFTIDQFIEYTVLKKESFFPSSDLEHCYHVYCLAKKVCPGILQGRETFAQFLPWTRELIHFIEQLDLENVESEALKHIEANANIGYEVPQDINQLLEKIVGLRQSYHGSIKENRHYSRGFQYLRASQVIGDVSFDEFDQILFCNFFYFHRCEEMIVKKLYEKGKATLIFQGDQRRWDVLSRISKSFSCSLLEGGEPKEPSYALKLYQGFDIHSQVSLVREVLKTIKNLDDTVVVVPQADRVIPLLSEIASLVGEFNVSMGYPLKRSSLYGLFMIIFKAQTSKKQMRYYAKDYLRLVRHPFIKNLKITENPALTRILIHKIEDILSGKEKSSLSGSLFFELEEIEKLEDLYLLCSQELKLMNISVDRQTLADALKEIHNICLRDWEAIDSFARFASALEQTLNVLLQKSFLNNYPFNVNIAQKMLEIKEELQQASFSKETFTNEEIFRIFDSKIEYEKISFSGSPLKGLQILGLLETRSLNFENVIMLDVNEGSLPKLNIFEPLIPREIMVSLNLDRLELEEEIQRYQFMRLISSAKNVHLIYQESKDKEKSRFVEELIWEAQKKSKNLDILPVTRASFAVNVETPKRVVQKTPDVLEFLRTHRYSASSINTYLRDPMEFYTTYVLGLREREDLLDEPEARQVGTFIHELLEEAFKPFLNKKPLINDKFRDRFGKIFQERFANTFERSMKSDSFLLKSVLKERLKRFLDHEELHHSRKVKKIMHLESRFTDNISLPCGDIKFQYIVDRVDLMEDGTIMIVDYKTGSIDQMPKSFDQIASMEFNRDSIQENIKSFQIPLYFYYLNRQFKDQPINAGLYNLRTLDLKTFINEKNVMERDKINEVFLNALDMILGEILDPKVPFERAVV